MAFGGPDVRFLTEDVGIEKQLLVGIGVDVDEIELCLV
jgi:hypothetical protein